MVKVIEGVDNTYLVFYKNVLRGMFTQEQYGRNHNIKYVYKIYSKNGKELGTTNIYADVLKTLLTPTFEHRTYEDVYM